MFYLENIFIIYISLLFFVFSEIYSFKCGSKYLNITPGFIDTLPKNKKRNMQEKKEKEEKPEIIEKNIIIGYDYTTFDNDTSVDIEIKNKTKQLLEEVSSIFKTLLKVKKKPIGVSNEALKELIKVRCKINETVENATDLILEKNDITIFPVFKEFESDENDMWMKGKYCLITRDMFPLGGLLEISKNISFTSNNSYDYFKHILFHQMTHILIFEPNLMKGLNMVEDNMVISEGVKRLAGFHFNCIKFIEEEDFGLPLDEDGYHWDSRYMLGDYMISLDYFDKTISDITLALFNDSGLYNVDNLYGRYFNFGKNKSCPFFENKCIENNISNFEEFCTENEEPKCSQSRLSKGSCYIKQYDNITIPNEYKYFGNEAYFGGLEETDYCPVSYLELDSNFYFSSNCKYGNESVDKEYGETFGKDSFCFISSLGPTSDNPSVTKSVCYQVECESKDKIIIVNIAGTKINCSSEGGVIQNPEGLNGTLICPKYNEICQEEIPDICRDMFDCINENYAREYTFGDDNSNKLIECHLLHIFIILFIFIFS